MKSLTVQNTPIPKQIFFPKLVSINSFEEERHIIAINKMTSAIKNVCTYIICLLTKLTNINSFFQLKYHGKMTCIIAKRTKM